MASEASPANGQAPPLDLANMISGIDKNQLMQLLQTVPGMFPRLVCLLMSLAHRNTVLIAS